MNDLEKLKDDWLKNLTYEIILTKRCNYRCKHCFIENFNSELKITSYKRTIDELQLLGIKEVHLSGGEIFLREDIKDILYYAKNKDCNISCVTNGSLINQTIITYIKETGLQLAISLDGPENIHNFIRNNKSAYKNVINSIKLLKENDLEFAIIFSAMKYNVGYINCVVEFCIENEINELRVQPIEPDGKAVHLLKENEILDSDEKTVFYKKIIDLSGQYISFIKISSLGSFKSEIVEHSCKLGINYGTNCHSNSLPWPNHFGINTEGYLVPINGYLNNKTFYLGHINEGLSSLLNKYYNSNSHKNFLHILKRTFAEDIIPQKEEYINLNILLNKRMENFMGNINEKEIL